TVRAYARSCAACIRRKLRQRRPHSGAIDRVAGAVGAANGMMEAAVTLEPREAAVAAAPAALSMDGVVRGFGDGPRVLEGVDLMLDPGVSAAISGPNGAGKTTLLRVAAGLITADAGR